MRRTGMAFQRTRMAADRTLMAIIRTALSLISFGFTIFQFFHQLVDKYHVVAVNSAAGRNFGLSLGLLGVGLLIAGLFAHVLLMGAMRRRRERLYNAGLLRTPAAYTTTPTAVVAILLLAVGIVSVMGM